MSASPVHNSAKRPLEDPSSPSGPSDQPDAKRPALDKAVKSEEFEEKPTVTEGVATLAVSNGEAEGNGVKDEPAKDEQGDTLVADVQPIETTASSRGTHDGAASNIPRDESRWIHIRAVISSAEAATVIGKGGENVSVIRKMSGAKCTVSDYQRGAVERILTVSGSVDGVAKAFGLIIRTLNEESLDAASTTTSKTYPLRLLVPHILTGAIIGKGGARIKEIQEASGARLNASDSCLPLSTERTLVVLGVADAVHIAAYYVGSTLMEQYTERFGGPSASAYATRSGGPAGVVPGGIQVVPYVPQAAGGSFGDPRNVARRAPRAQPTPGHAYGTPYQAQAGATQPQATQAYGQVTPAAGYGGVGPQQPGQTPQAGHAGPAAQPMQGMVPGQPLTQQIYIPNDMVGAIIGKGGAKINEIRQLSGSVIKINEPQDNSNERLVTITGTAECNQMALYMLYSRLESEKHRM